MRKTYLLGCFLLAITAAKAQNNAVTLSGGTDYIDCGNNAALSATNIRTMECWVKFATVAGDREILSKSNAGFGIELLQFGGNLSAYFMFNASNVSYITYPMSNFQTGVWYHIATTWNGTKENIRLYVNGVSVGTINHIGNITSTGVADPAASFRIGQWSGTPSRPFSGTIDEVRLWTTNRTAAEIKNGMYNAVANNAAGLIAYYKFNEGSGAAAANSSVTAGLNGSLVNSPSWTTSPIWGGSNALHFDGVDDQVVVPANNLFNLSSGTVEFRIKPSAMGYNGCIAGVRGAAGTRFSFHINTSTNRIGLWNNTFFSSVPYTFTTGTWYHIAFVTDGSVTSVYINGAYQGQLATTFGTLTGLPFAIGIAKNSGSDGEPYLGEIDEVRLWNTQRTATEINNNKDISLTGTETGLIAQYNFNQGTGGTNNSGVVTLIDQTTNNLHGTLSNFALNNLASNYTGNFMTILPVRLSAFTATRKGAEVMLQWQTESEQNSRLFTVERSNNGTSFTAIGSVPAAGKASAYSFTDAQPMQGTNYYRIRQVDHDNRSQQSTVCVVSFTTAGSFTWLNHQNGSCTLLLKGGTNEAYTVSDMNGRLLESGKLGSGRKTVVLPRAGTYIATVVQNGEVLSTRLVVL